jgi:hypothetical protein
VPNGTIRDHFKLGTPESFLDEDSDPIVVSDEENSSDH